MQSTLPVGTIISIGYKLFDHFGVYVGNNRVIHCSKAIGFAVESHISEFMDGKQIKRQIPPSSPNHGQQIVARAQEWLGTEYNLFKRNCEHLVNYANSLKPYSPQIQTLVAFSAITLVVLFIFKK